MTCYVPLNRLPARTPTLHRNPLPSARTARAYHERC